MAYNTLINQGTFVSAGENVILDLRSSFDWIRVYNFTAASQAAANLGFEYYWQRGMAQGSGLFWSKLGTVTNDPITVSNIAANEGFFEINSTGNPVGAQVAQTGITNATQPTVSTADTGQLATGSIVRLSSDSNLPNIMGFDIEIDNVIANTSFEFRYALANVPGAVGAGNGFYRPIAFDPIYYPRHRYIVNISQATQGVVTTSVSHGYTVGQQVRMQVPAAFEMTQLDNQLVTIVDVPTAGSFTIDVDTSAYTPFVFPAVALVPFTFAQVVPVGADTGESIAQNVNILADATRNQGIIGAQLIAGANSPAGQASDVIYWRAGKSFGI